MAKNRKSGASQAEVRKMIDRRVNAAISAQMAQVTKAADQMGASVDYADALEGWALQLRPDTLANGIYGAIGALSKQQGTITKLLKALSAEAEGLTSLVDTQPPKPALSTESPAAAVIANLQAQISTLTTERDDLARQVGDMANQLVDYKSREAHGVAPNWLSRLARQDRHTEEALVETGKRALKWAANGV